MLRRPGRYLLRPVLRRIEQVSDRTEEVRRHLPLVENAIESQNAELRSRARADSDLRAELASVKAELIRISQQLDALQRESGPGSLTSSPNLGTGVGSRGDDQRAASGRCASR